MTVTEKIAVKIEAEVDTKSFQEAEKEVVSFARDTKKQLDSTLLLKLRLDKANLQLELENTRKLLNQAKKDGDQALTLDLQVKTDKLKSSLTEAGRQLNNYVNTGSTSQSRLQAKFNEVNSNIQKQGGIIRLDKANLQLELENTRKLLNQAKKDGDQALALDLQVKTDKLKSSLTEAGRQLNNYVNTGSTSQSRLQAKFNEVNSSIQKQGGIIGTLKTEFIGLSGIISSGFSISKLTGVSDTFNSMQNAIRQVADGKEIDILQNKILNLANDARVPVDSLTKSFVRFDLVNKQLGGTQDETLKLLDSLSKGLTMTGASAEETSSSMLQLSQAFGSGKLAGDEFRSLSENMPMLMDILAKSLGVPRGQLKELASDGQITSEVLKKALIEANDQINASFQNSQKTIGQALTQIRNDFIIKFGEIDKAGGVTSGVVKVLDFLKTSILAFIEAFPGFTGALTLGTIALGAFGGAIALLGGPITALIGIFGALVTTIGYFSNKTKEAVTSQEKLTNITKEQAKETENLKNKQEELNKKYNEGVIGNIEYKKSTEDNKKALEDLAISQLEVQKGLDIINNKQLNYKQKVEELNGLKLNSSEYNKLIDIIKTLQQEQLKAIQLDQQLLKSKISSLKEPTVELQKASADLNNAFNQVLTTGEGGLSTNQNKSNISFEGTLKNGKFVLNQTQEQIKAQKEYEKQVKISNTKNTAEINKYNKELEELKKQEEDLLKISREAEDIIKKPTTITPTGGGGGGTKPTGGSSKVKTAEEEAKELEKIQEEEAKAEIERQEKMLKYFAQKEVEKVKQSEMSEYNKAKAIVKINEQLNKDISALNKDTATDELSLAQMVIEKEKEKNDKIKDNLEVLEDGYKKVGDVFKDSIDDSKKAIDELKDKITDTAEEISKIDEELNQLETGRATTLGERNVEILERQKEIQKELNDLKKEGVNIGLASTLSENTLNALSDSSVLGSEVDTVENLKKVLELQTEQNSLLEEQAIIKNNASTTELENAQRMAKLSSTEKYLEEYNKEKDLLEKKKILKQQELADFTAQKLQEETILTNLNNKKIEIDNNYLKLKTELEQQITDDLLSQNQTRIDSLKSVELQAIATAKALQTAGANTSNDTGSTTNKTVNNTFNVSTEVDAQALLNNINNKI